METSILNSTKKILGLGDDYTPFDLDILTHINAAFAVLNQLGVGPDIPFSIEDSDTEWADFDCTAAELQLIKTYIFLKVRMLFDPPTTSFLLAATEKQIQEYEHRISEFREVELWETTQAALNAEEVI
jgi:hypothetical protein